MLNKFALALVALGTATASQALTAVFTPGAPDPGPLVGSNFVVNFDGALPAGATLTGSYNLVTGSVPNVYAAPAGDTSRYLYVSSTLGSTMALLTTPALNRVSFYWGSIDKYNTVQVLGTGGSVLSTFTGADWPPANGNQTSPASNGRVYFAAQGNERITGLRFASSGVALELDTVAGVVPEPATWAMFVVGFGLVGASVRRRNRKTVSVAA